MHRSVKVLNPFLGLLLALLVIACAGEERILTVDYPLPGSVFPPDFTPPTILWHDATSRATAWRITLEFKDGGAPLTVQSSGPPPADPVVDETVIGENNEIYRGTPYQQSAHTFTPDGKLWADIQRRSALGPAVLVIEGLAEKDSKESLSRGETTFTTSTDPVDAPIFFRDVPLIPSVGEDGKIAPVSPDALHWIAWRLRDVSLPDSKVLLTGMVTCANCHSFSRDGKTLGMDVDGPQGDKGSYAIAPLAETTVISKDEVITWNSFPGKPEGHRTIGFLSRVSPDGSYVLSTVNEELYVNNFIDYRFLQVFYPTRGILAYYSKATREMKALPGADDTEYVHCGPVWFPDGGEIIFCRATARAPYPPEQPRPKYAGDPNELEVKFDLYRMPFNDGKGGTPVPVAGASNNGMSNTFPKISPDGKWLVFTQCKNGLLMRPDGRLWIINLKTGEAREMNCNTSLMNSWHSFSPNSRWMVFSSKANTPYTQMFLTHIDENGIDTPPILIPNNTVDNRAVNIPEFVNRPYDSLNAIDVPAVDHHLKLGEGIALAGEGRLEEALIKLEEAVAAEPGFTRAMLAASFALIEMGQVEEARAKLAEVLELDPNSGEAYNNLGLSYKREGRTGRAVKSFRMAVEVEPRHRNAHANLGLTLYLLGKPQQALASLRTATELDPTDVKFRNDLIFVQQQLGRWGGVLAEYRAALKIAPDNLSTHADLANALRESGQTEASVEQYRELLELRPGDPEAARCLSELLMELGRVGEAVPYLEVLQQATPDDPASSLNLAWLLATLPDQEVRNGQQAVALAEHVRTVHGDSAGILDVLAAAYAEAGRFDEAVKTAEQALKLQAEGQGQAMPGLAERAKGYAAGQAHRQ